ANILLTADGVAKLADFGIAKFSKTAHTVTPSGSVIGTPEYMSPEQCRSEPLDVRTDLYSMGAAYYAMLTGRTPFRGETPLQTMFAHCSSPIPNPCEINPKVPASCAAIVARAMNKDRSARYPSAAALLAELDAALASDEASGETPQSDADSDQTLGKTERLSPVTPRKRKRLLLVAVAVLLAAVMGVSWHFLVRASPDGKEETPSRPPRALSLRFRSLLRESRKAEVPCVRVSPDGRLLAVAESTGIIRLCSLPSG